MELLETITIIILIIFGLSLISTTVFAVLILNQIFKISKTLTRATENIENLSHNLVNPITTIAGVIAGITGGKNVFENVKNLFHKEKGETIYEE